MGLVNFSYKGPEGNSVGFAVCTFEHKSRCRQHRPEWAWLCSDNPLLSRQVTCQIGTTGCSVPTPIIDGYLWRNHFLNLCSSDLKEFIYFQKLLTYIQRIAFLIRRSLPQIHELLWLRLLPGGHVFLPSLRVHKRGMYSIIL